MSNTYGITLEQAIEQRNAWLDASAAVSQSQQYTINSGGTVRTLTRADAAEVLRMVKFWEEKVKSLSGGRRRRVRFGVAG